MEKKFYIIIVIFYIVRSFFCYFVQLPSQFFRYWRATKVSEWEKILFSRHAENFTAPASSYFSRKLYIKVNIYPTILLLFSCLPSSSSSSSSFFYPEGIFRWTMMWSSPAIIIFCDNIVFFHCYVASRPKFSSSKSSANWVFLSQIFLFIPKENFLRI